MKAAYNFKLETGVYDDSSEVVVVAESYKEAETKAKSLIDGSKIKIGKLHRVIDLETQVSNQNIIERKLTVEERNSNINYTGEITEYKVKGPKK